MKRGRKTNEEARKCIKELLNNSLKGVVTREDLWRKFKHDYGNVCSKSLFFSILDDFERKGWIKREVIYKFSKIAAYKVLKIIVDAVIANVK
ncbi:MAG: hypothetical protein NTU57_00320 [Candidatus Aenigmarchaeota archaeon]|nr:hypothetical protein [Candidatus Aenigmarchaeota archaeon]